MSGKPPYVAEVFKSLRKAHICTRCCLRFMGCKTIQSYVELPESICSDEGVAENSNKMEQIVCAVCLGILQFADAEMCKDSLLRCYQSSGYKVDDCVLNVSVPTNIRLREASCWLFLESQLTRVEFEQLRMEALDLKEAVKWVLGHWLETHGGLPFKPTSNFVVSATFQHKESEQESRDFLRAVGLPSKKKKVSSSSYQERNPSHHDIQNAMAALSSNNLASCLHVPPMPCKNLSTISIVCEHRPLFVKGYYRKYSRMLSQSPWLIDGKAMTRSSVQEEIAKPFAIHLASQSISLSAAGREDVDVRMLGGGRPFVLEIRARPITHSKDPKSPQVLHGPQFLESMEKEINTASSEVEVCRLTITTSDVFEEMKTMEEQKRKSYRCVVWTAEAKSKAEVEKLNDIHELKLNQTTPIRVLHRRTLLSRPKTIHMMTATWINPHFFLLDLEAQAGTYIKEFVHGDRGRTVPNVGQLLETPADIIQLDVVGLTI